MKRTLLIPIIALALCATWGVQAHAQSAPADSGTASDPVQQQLDAAQKSGDLPDYTASPIDCPPGDQVCQQINAAQTQVNEINAHASQVPTPPLTESSYGWIMTPIMSLFAWLVGVAALLLDNTVYYTVIHMGAFTGLETGQSGLAAIGVAWRILRDIANVVLIFGFLAIGIGVIVDYTIYGSGTKMLPKLLIVAVLINFSLFVSGAVISVGNLFATQFYTQINGGVPPTPQLSFDAIHQEGISNKIMAQLGLQTLYGNAIAKPDALNPSNSWFIGFMGILLFIVTAFVFFSLALILVARFVALVFLIIVAPIGFVGLAIPQLEKTAKEWWGQLVHQTFIAPVLFLMLYVALAVITDQKFLGDFGGTGGSWLGFIGSSRDLSAFAGIMLSFIIAMGLLLAVTILAKKLSAFGAGWATSWGGKASFGMTSYALRNTVGAGSMGLANGLRKTRFARIPLVGTGAVRGLEGLSKSSFDVRGIKTVNKQLGAGEAQKGGYKKDLEDAVKKRTSYAEGLKGRELTKEEKERQSDLNQQVRRALGHAKEARKERARYAPGSPGYVTAQANVDRYEEEAKRLQGQLDTIESVTDKGAKRKYARMLNWWSDDKNFFNSYINPAANTQAAKQIRDKLKQTKQKETLDALSKIVSSGGAAGGTPAAGAGGGHP